MTLSSSVAITILPKGRLYNEQVVHIPRNLADLYESPDDEPYRGLLAFMGPGNTMVLRIEVSSLVL